MVATLEADFGLPSDAEVTREIFLNCVHPEDRERIDWAIMQSLAGVNDGFYNVEYRIVHPGDNSLHWVTAQGQAFFDAAGLSIRFIGAVVDISDRKQVEEFTARLNLELESKVADRTKERIHLEGRLRQSERHLGVAQGLSLTGSFSWFASSGKIVWSDETYRIYGYDTSIEPSMELAMQRVHPDDLSLFEERAKNAPVEGKDFTFQHRLLMPDGTIKHVKVITGHIGEESGPGVLVGALMDITAQIKTEEALRASERVARGQVETLKEILNSISTELDPDKIVEHVLRMIAKQMGGQSVSVFRRNNDDTLTPEVILDEKGLRVLNEMVSHTTGDQPLWAEAFRLETECLVTEFDRDPIWFRFVHRPASEGVPRINAMTLPSTAAVHQQLKAHGVILSLIIPMVTSGRVSGFIGIRFTKRREFPPEEIDLSRALAQQAALAMQLMRLSREGQQTAVMAERNRMARDIHDTLAQGFTGIIAQLQAAKGSSTLADVSAHLERAENLARSSLGEARRSVRALRPRSLHEGTLCMALENLLKTVAPDSGLKAEFVIVGEQRTIFAGMGGRLATHCPGISDERDQTRPSTRLPSDFELRGPKDSVENNDDGHGFNPEDEHEGFGIIGMKERIDQMGGQFVIHSQPGHGTETVITLPCPTTPKPTNE